MINLLVYDDGEWQRFRLPGDGCAFVNTEAEPPVVIDDCGIAVLPSGADGIILVCDDGVLYHVAVSSAAYLNAETTPLHSVRALRNHDRITYHRAGKVLRVWILDHGLGVSPYDEVRTSQHVCTYCSQHFLPTDLVQTCTGCQEVAHVDCLEHGGQKCPRCGLAVATPTGEWLPAGFADLEVPDDQQP